jgi:succinate dehydrogenase / fumarate reductase cytochrome b subunit
MKLFIINSSIGRKLIMSLSGLFLFLFLTLHCFLNMFLLGGPSAYTAVNDIMELPIVTIMVPILAAGFVIHILYALWLYWQNYRARGDVGYASGKKSETTSWAARNMVILGLIVLLFIVLHLTQFWAKMQLQSFLGGANQVHADQSYDLVANQFRNPIVSVLYIIWYWVLWFHLTHGFWSAFQTIGIDNKKWQPRLQIIGIVYATILAVCFTSINLYFLFGFGA